MPTRSQVIAADVAALLRARNPLLWVVTREEVRVESHLFQAAASAGYIARTWDVAQGAAEISGKRVNIGSPDPGEMLGAIGERSGERALWIMRDLPIWLTGITGAATCRALRNVARALPAAPRTSAQAIVILSPSSDVPPELAGHATVIEWPMPDREEIAAILDAAIDSLPDDIKAQAAPNGTRDAAIDAAIGLSGEEAASCYARSLVQTKTIDPAQVAREKKRVIAREKVLEWIDPLSGGLDAVGGLDNLKTWLASRKDAYSPAARAYGLPAPKGAMLVGISGCGKSLTAKAIATAWGVPLLRLDFGALKSKFVGESEGNIRKAYAVIAAIGRCVLWIDEVEKAMAGATDGAADGGVSGDALGSFLTWMQERPEGCFVIATANDVSKLPPEFLRKGRFDEVFWIDLPTQEERCQIIVAALRAHGRNFDAIALSEVSQACQDFTGSEVAEIIPDALYRAFADGARKITTNDLLAAAATVVPLAKTAKEKIAAMRAWASGRARPATTSDNAAQAASQGRQLDL